MPDRNYDVDDILREIRRRQPAEPQHPAPPARAQEPPARSLWEEDEVEEAPRPSRLSSAKPPRAPRQEAPARSLWEEDEVEEAPRPGRTPSAKPPRAPRQEAPARSLWEEDEVEEAPRPGRTPSAKPPRAARQEAPARSLWEEDEEEAPRPSRTPAAKAPRTPRQEARSRARWEAEDEQPPSQSTPALPRSARTSSREIPSLSRWEEEYQQPAVPEPPQPSRPQPAPRQEEPVLSLWEEPSAPETPKSRATGRGLDAAAAARLITGGDEPEGRRRRRKGEEERPRSRRDEDEEERPRSRRDEDEEERPRPRRGRDEDEEERPRPRRGRDEEEEERPRPRRSRGEEEEERPRPRRSRGEEEEERPRPRRSRDGEEEERPRVRIGAQLQGMKTGLIIRLVVNLLCAAGVIYLMLAPGHELPIPDYFMENPSHYLWLGVGLVVLSALVAGNTVGGGIISLVCLRPNNDSYSAIGVFACLVQGAYMAMRPEMMGDYAANLYLPMAALLLLFNTVGKLILRGRVAGSYRFIAQEGAKHTAAIIEDYDLAGRIGGDIIDDDPEIAYFTRSAGVLAFLDQAFSESKAEDVSKVIAPMTAVAALVMALISYPFHKDIFTSACVFTAALCITAPVAGVIAANLPIALANRKLGRWGTTLCGYSAVDQFAGVNQVLLRGYDLFPPESVTLHTIKPFNRTPMDQVVIDIASVLSQCGSTLTQIFTGMIDRPEMLRQTESFLCEDGKGVSAWVEGRRVLIGNRELMKSYGVAIPPKEYEDQYGQGKQILYISNSGQAAAMCVLSYKADKQMRRALEVLADRDIAVCVYTTDPNVTAERVSQTYAFPRELVKVIPAALHREVDRYLDPNAKARAGMVHNGTPSSYIRGVAAARSCDNALTVETALLLLSVVVGFALVTFFAFTGGMPALTWVTIAAYQAFWAFIELLVAFIKSN